PFSANRHAAFLFPSRDRYHRTALQRWQCKFDQISLLNSVHNLRFAQERKVRQRITHPCWNPYMDVIYRSWNNDLAGNQSAEVGEVDMRRSVHRGEVRRHRSWSIHLNAIVLAKSIQ